MAIFDFIKKTPSNANQSSAPQGASTGSAQNTPVTVSQVSSTQSTQPQQMPQGQSYNGIGNPSGGHSYNGIGSTPSGQAPYNGIGSTPSGGAPYNGIGNTSTGKAPYNGIGAPTQSSVAQSQSAQPPKPQAEPTMPEVKSVMPTPPAPLSPKDNADNKDRILDTSVKSNSSNPQQGQQSNRGPSGPQLQNTKSNQSSDQRGNNQNSQNNQTNQSRNNQNQNQNTSNNQNNKKQDVKPTAPNPQALKSNITNDKRSDLDIMTHMTQRSNKVFVEANNKARDLKNIYVDSEHILHGLMTDGEIYKILVDMKIQPQIIEEELNKVYKKETSPNPPQISPRVKQITSNSLVIARKLGYEFVSPEHLLIALYEEGEGVGARVLTKLGLQKPELYKKITGKSESLLWDTSPGAKDKAQKQQRTALQQFTIDLTEKASKGELDPVVERSDVIERLVHVLSRRIKNNPALIGEPGVGKTAVVEGLAQRIVNKQVPESLLGKRILVLDLTSVVAGASHRGEFEERMKNIVEELKGAKGEVIMFIDEMHTMMGAGGGDGALDASNFIKPALARGEVQLIGATTITEYRKYIEKDAALERRFQTVLVPEPTVEAAIKMLKAARDKYESFHKVKISDDIIELATKLSKRYMGDRFLPDKAFDLMDEGAAAVRLPLISLPEEIKSFEDQIAKLKQELASHEARGEKVRARIMRSKIDDISAKLNEKKDEYNMKKAQTTTEVTADMIKDIVARRTGIPISKISDSEGDKLVKMEDIIHKRMIDQERAVTSVAQAIRRGRAGLKSNNRPIGSFVFLGPTGVGKTELAKTISEVLFDEEEAVIRFDMTEYMERHEVAKLLGPPPGYVGFEEGGKLTEMVRRKPYSVVLFDEVEKAHPDIFNILLQILDDARLTDNKGRTISFKNTVIICTSNIGTRLIQEELLKSGKTEVSEPNMVSTYVFTPRGREILTIGNKYFERDGVSLNTIDPQKAPVSPEGEPKKDQKENDPNTASVQEIKKDKTKVSWESHALPEYFAGQKLDGSLVKSKAEPTPEEKGLEKDATSTPDDAQKKPETQEPDYTATAKNFPAFGYDTHAISPQGLEVVTKGNTVYSRNATTAKVWNATNLIDYFKDQIVINAIPDAPDEQLPTIKLKTHAYTPDEKEIVSYKDRFWRRKINSTDWETGMLKDYFVGTTAEKEGDLPVTHWDIHTFSPAGREIIVVGTDIWYKDAKQTAWKKQALAAYFGEDFPLDKEIEEKEKVENETDKKKYDVIKEKVMNELLKFFRPELVNRFDEVIVFEPLKFIHMIAIVKLQLKSLSKLLEEQEMGFSVTETAIKQIVREGFDPIFGARPLKRSIQKLVENPISELIIAKKVKPGDTIIVDYDGEEFLFNVEKIEKKKEMADEKKDGQTGKESDAKKKFFCETCANRFETQVKPTATTVCTKCASKNVTEVTGDVKKESMKDAVNSEKKVGAEGSKNTDPQNDSNIVSTSEPKKDEPKAPEVSNTNSQAPNMPKQDEQPIQMNTV